jgi:hypothetical protein
MNKESSVKILTFTAVGLFLTVVIFGLVEICSISTIRKMESGVACGGDGIWLIDSTTGDPTHVDAMTYVDERVAVNEMATTSYGVNYSKEGQMTLLDADCDVKEAFEILNCILMRVEIKTSDTVYHRAYAKGSDGFTYLVETDENGSISRDGDGNAKILKRCDFTDLYLGED